MTKPATQRKKITEPQRSLPQFAAIFAVILAVLTSAPLRLTADPPAISGSGNFTTGNDEVAARSQFAGLRSMGAQAIRLDVYPYFYYDGKNPLPEKMEAQILAAHKEGVGKIILLFEFAGNYQRHSDAPNKIGDYDKWRSLGVAYAQHYAPNSPWLKSQGIVDWGITVFQAFNEPDAENPADFIPRTGPASYHDALKGLADGVHSVAPSLAVIPGGFMAENAWSDHTLRGYGPAIAELLNDGTLAGIDLHTYNDIQYAPIIRPDGSVTCDFSPQTAFENVKKACHITRDIDFFTTEYNFKANTQGIAEPLAAKRLLTCIWANLGVMKNDGKTSATRLALAWNLFFTQKEDQNDGGWYSMVLQHDPWLPTERGKTFQLVMTLAKGMEFTSLDPKGKGEYILEGAAKKMWVWQNYPHWTNHPGTSFTVEGIPVTATRLDLYGWDGLRSSIPISGQTSCDVTNLGVNETFMFVAVSPGN